MGLFLDREKLVEQYWINDAVLDGLDPGSGEYDRVLKKNRVLCDRIVGFPGG